MAYAKVCRCCVSVLLLIVPIASVAQADSTQTLNKLDAQFDGYFAWFGSMYDRQSGGAYYSSAARSEPDQYPPHMESTSKYCRSLEWAGLIETTPKPVADAIVKYVKDRQVSDPHHPYRGFFLDENYASLSPSDAGSAISPHRVNRAVGFATGILKLFNAKPDHPLPSLEENEKALAHLQSAEAYRKWLASLDWDRTWTAGGYILAQDSNINRLNDEQKAVILNVTWDYLEKVQQDPKTGLWGNAQGASNQQPYIMLNGAHKIAAFYAKYQRDIPHAQSLINTALAEVQSTPATNLLYVYNASQLVKNVRTMAGVTVTREQIEAFVENEAAYLSRFRQSDGGFSGSLTGSAGNGFQPAVSGPHSNTDVSGLALKTRDTLHDLIAGSHQPLEASRDPRIFGMSGVNSSPIVQYSFKTDTPDITLGKDFSIKSSPIRTVNDEGKSRVYEFTLTPSDQPLNLYFLAITTRGDTQSSKPHRVSVTYRVGEGTAFVDAGRTTIRKTPVTRDIPLLTEQPLQRIKSQVTFRIRFDSDPSTKTVDVDDIQLYGVPAL